MNTKLFLKAFLGALLLTAIYLVVYTLMGFETRWGSSHWALLSNFLITLMLALYITHSSRRGFRLGLEVFLVYFVIGHFNLLIEAYIFNVTNRAQTMLELARGLLVAIIFSPIFMLIVANEKAKPPRPLPTRSVLSWTWRVLAADCLYLLCYISAGIILSILYPRLLEFYEGKLPSIGIMVQTQFFLRGLIFTGAALLMFQSMSTSLFKKAILTGFMFSIVGGIAPLIPPSDLMPAYVRLVHGIEVGISNFVFGFLLTYLIGYHAPQIRKSQKVKLSEHGV